MVSDCLLESAMESYELSRETLRYVSGGRETAKQFYSFKKQGNSYILRFTKCNADHIGQTRAEMDWLCYLAGKGIHVPCPLRAVNGEFAVSSEENGETYSISAYSMAEGQRWNKNDPNLWNEKVFTSWGKVMGNIHRETKDFRPANEVNKRREYTSIIGDGVKAFPSVSAAAEALDNEISTLPKDRDSYGLIHYDLHPDNFFIDGDRINVFDFDDCAYAWYALDIGVALYSGLWFGRHNDAGHDFTNDIVKHFLKGYLSANHLDDFWLSKIPMFMRLCQIAKFSYAYRCESPDDDHQKERMHNIEKYLLFTGCTMDHSLFTNIKQ